MTKTIDYDVWTEPLEGPAVSGDDYPEVTVEVSDEELVMAPLPIQRDEFRCGCCFLICHTSRRAGGEICIDCV